MSTSEGPLVIIQDLVKLCNHPDLLKDRYKALPEESDSTSPNGRKYYTSDPNRSYFVGTKEIMESHKNDLYFSGKFFVLENLLTAFREGKSTRSRCTGIPVHKNT